MNDILHGYSVNDSTWFYLSLLLVIAVFFRFNRLWSLRNFDLLLLLSVSPGLLILEHDTALGNIWLFVSTGLFLMRTLMDAWFKRRPLLEQNLNSAGLGFLCVAAFGFQLANIVTEEVPATTLDTFHKAQELVTRTDSTNVTQSANSGQASVNHESTDPEKPGPAMSLLATPALLARNYRIAGWILSGLSHMAVVLGLIVLGRRHLNDVRLGIAMATMYLLLPCTAYQVHQVSHVMPAALIIWSINYYHRPMIAGCCMGLACGTVFFPVFLLPVWMLFYGRNGSLRFALALGCVAAVIVGSFALTSANFQSFIAQTIGSINWSVFQFQGGYGVGFWSNIDQVYRLPVVTAFLVLVALLTFFPRQKNIEHLMAHSAAIVVATQLWYPQYGGIYVLWYLPLMLTVVFRPRLAHLIPPESAPLLRLARQSTPPREERPLASAPRQQLR